MVTPPKKRILLFGASKGGETFIRHNTEHQVVAIADNDPSKWGKKLLDQYPIIAPESIPQLDYDEIVITSLWIDSIHPQLTQTLGVPPERIRVPHKREMKAHYPFQHPETLTLAHELLIQTTRWLKKHQLDYYLDSGTLLGLVREGDLIAWDDDIDVALNPDAFNQLIQLAPSLYQALPRPTEINWSIWIHSQADEDVLVNLEFESIQPEAYLPFDLSLLLRRPLGDQSELVSSAGIFSAPVHHFSGHTQLSALGESFQVPQDYEAFLTFMYGEWRKPRKNMALNDYDNRQVFTGIDPRSISIRKRLVEPA